MLDLSSPEIQRRLVPPKQKLWLRAVRATGRGIWAFSLWAVTTTKRPEPKPEPTRWARPWVQIVQEELVDPSPCACLRMIVWIFLVLALITLPYHLAFGS